MRSRIKTAVGRAKYAAIGAAVGAGVGGLLSRNAASTGGAVGGLAGAILGETRVSAETSFGELKKRFQEEVSED
jgi:osmotically inducible lipoprotein OsmB